MSTDIGEYCYSSAYENGISMENTNSLQLTCELCDHQLTEPVMLNCLHVFDKNCLLAMESHRINAEQMKCPKCDITSSLSTFIPLNFILSTHKKLHSTSSSSDDDGRDDNRDFNDLSKCIMCTTGENGIYKCPECAGIICERCYNLHKEVVIFQSHYNIQRLTPYEKENIKETVKSLFDNKPVKCHVHKEDNLESYCYTCYQSICGKCVAQDQHKAHEITPLSELLQNIKPQFDTFISQCKNIKEKSSTKMERLNNALLEVAKARDLNKSRIEQAYEIWKSYLDQMRDEFIGMNKSLHDDLDLKLMTQINDDQKKLDHIDYALEFIDKYVRRCPLVESSLLIRPALACLRQLSSSVTNNNDNKVYSNGIDNNSDLLDLENRVHLNFPNKSQIHEILRNNFGNIGPSNDYLQSQLSGLNIYSSLYPGSITNVHNPIGSFRNTTELTNGSHVMPHALQTNTSNANIDTMNISILESLNNSTNNGIYSPHGSNGAHFEDMRDLASMNSFKRQPYESLQFSTQSSSSSHHPLQNPSSTSSNEFYPISSTATTISAVTGQSNDIIDVATIPTIPSSSSLTSLAKNNNTATASSSVSSAFFDDHHTNHYNNIPTPPLSSHLTGVTTTVQRNTPPNTLLHHGHHNQLGNVPPNMVLGLQHPNQLQSCGSPVSGSLGTNSNPLLSPVNSTGPLVTPSGSSHTSGSMGASRSAMMPMNPTMKPPFPRNRNYSPMVIKERWGSQGSTKGQLNSPHGFCLGFNEEIVVADTQNHRIQIFNKDGLFMNQFGIAGREEGNLWHPRKVTIIRNTQHYVVCDRGSERSRMQIFAKNGYFIRKIAIPYIDIVAGLAIDNQNNIVAVDSVSPTIFVVTESGEMVNWIECSSQMREPSDIVVHGDNYYICDFKGHCVCVYKQDGSFLFRFGSEKITNYPNGIDISNHGDVLVGDSHGNRFHVAVFSKEGHLTGEFECPSVKVSRACGLKITSEGYLVTLAKNNHNVLVIDTLYVH